jgi:hypothetical protein
MPSSMLQRSFVPSLVWLVAAANGRRPRIAPLREGAGAGRFQHGEWTALLARFVHHSTIDYGTMSRVRRLLEVYLHRLAEADPEAFVDADDQLAFFLNAYNAIAVHQILLHYPVGSIRDIPGALTAPYPVGRQNLSLHTLHANVLRSFGDPRVHAAINPGTRGAGPIQAAAFTGSELQSQLDGALRRLLSDPEQGAHFDVKTKTLYLSSIFRLFGGDFLQPHTMPSLSGLAVGWLREAALLRALIPYLPSDLAIVVRQSQPYLRFLPYNWAINDRLTGTETSAAST